MKKIVLFMVVLFSAIWCKTHNDSDTKSNAKTKESSSVNTKPEVSTPIEAATAVIDASKDFANSTCDAGDTQCQSLQTAASAIANADPSTLAPYMNPETLNAAASNVNTNTTTTVNTNTMTDSFTSTATEDSTSTNVSTNAKTNPYLAVEIALPIIVSVWIFGVAAIALKMKISSTQWDGIYKELGKIEGYDRNASQLSATIERLSMYVSSVKQGEAHFTLFDSASYEAYSVTRRTEEVFVLQVANQYLEGLLTDESLSEEIKFKIKNEILKNKKAILAKTADKQMLIDLVESAISTISDQANLVRHWHLTSDDMPLYRAITHADRSTVRQRIERLELSPEQIERGVLQVLDKQTPAQIHGRMIPEGNPLRAIPNLVKVHYASLSRGISRNLVRNPVRNPEIHMSRIRLTDDTESPKNIYIQSLIRIAKQIQKFKH